MPTRPVAAARRRGFIAALSVFALAALCFFGVSSSRAQDEERQGTGDHMFRSVTVVVDYGQDVEKRWSLLPWKPGMTALDAMLLAQAKPEPLGLRFDHVGAGERAFVKSIEGLPNEGGRAGDRNWVYFINGKRADRSCGAATLEHGDTVTWRYVTMGRAGGQ